MATAALATSGVITSVPITKPGPRTSPEPPIYAIVRKTTAAPRGAAPGTGHATTATTCWHPPHEPTRAPRPHASITTKTAQDGPKLLDGAVREESKVAARHASGRRRPSCAGGGVDAPAQVSRPGPRLLTLSWPRGITASTGVVISARVTD